MSNTKQFIIKLKDIDDEDVYFVLPHSYVLMSFKTMTDNVKEHFQSEWGKISKNIKVFWLKLYILTSCLLFYVPLKRLTPEEIQRMTQEEIKKMTPEKIQKMIQEKIKRMTPEEIKRMIPEEIQRMTPEEIKRMTPEEIQRMIQEKIQRMTKEEIQRMISEEIQKMTLEEIMKFKMSEKTLSTTSATTPDIIELGWESEYEICGLEILKKEESEIMVRFVGDVDNRLLKLIIMIYEIMFIKGCGVVNKFHTIKKILLGGEVSEQQSQQEEK